MVNPTVLIVEDNPILQRQLKAFLTQKGLTWIFTNNENEAMEKLTHEVQVVVADIDLSEAGGEPDGGIKLSKRLSEEGWKIPVILISQTPLAHFPAPNNPDYITITHRYNIHSIMDRNDISFREDLTKKILEILDRERSL